MGAACIGLVVLARDEHSLPVLFLLSVSTDTQLPGCRGVSRVQSQVLLCLPCCGDLPSPTEDLQADSAPDSQLSSGYFHGGTELTSLHMGRCEQRINVFLESCLPSTRPSSCPHDVSRDGVTRQLVAHPMSPDLGFLFLVAARIIGFLASSSSLFIMLTAPSKTPTPTRQFCFCFSQDTLLPVPPYVCWVILFCQLGTTEVSLGRENLNGENVSIRLACRQMGHCLHQ